MEFETTAQESLYARVESFLRQLFGELPEALEDDPSFILRLGRVPMMINVNANGPELASIMLYAVVGGGIAITHEVASYLLHQGHSYPFAAITLQDDDQITLMHTLFGEGVTKQNLMMLAHMFSDYCDELDEQLTMQFR